MYWELALLNIHRIADTEKEKSKWLDQGYKVIKTFDNESNSESVNESDIKDEQETDESKHRGRPKKSTS